MAAAAPATNPAAAAERFWRFSLAVYGRPGVAAACVALQDRWGLDVNLLLWCCWHAAEGRGLSAADLAAAIEAARPWQAEVVQPLRALRRRLKPGLPPIPADRVEVLRSGIKEVELEAERIAQGSLAAMAAGGAGEGAAAGVARANLEAYFRQRHVKSGDDDRAALATLLNGAFPAER